MKKLPIGIQSFEKLREQNCIYVDKTKNILEIINNGSIYFLSRPRRFGKSLLVSTFDELFSGNKKLFEGLYIYDKWDWETKYPVIHLDFSQLAMATPDELKISLRDFLNSVATQNSIKLVNGTLAGNFSELIEKLHETTGQKVVLLIDEYDKPVIDNISEPEVLKENLKILHNFYQVIKGADSHLKFVFLTGVSKFASMSIFSALNSLDDISLDKKYAALCGYTQEELESNFKEHIQEVAKKFDMSFDKIIEHMKVWYNGYTWDGKTSVYNPFSTLLFLKNEEFAAYWFSTGTPTFLLEIIKSYNKPSEFLNRSVVSADVFRSGDPLNVKEIPLLFQTGYLTIKEIARENIYVNYTMDFPNHEVQDAFLKSLLNYYTADACTDLTLLQEK